MQYNTLNVLNFCTPKFLTKWYMQTMQTQIRQSRVYTVYHSTKYLKKVFKTLGHLKFSDYKLGRIK